MGFTASQAPDVQHTSDADLYRLLGVDRTATQRDIAKAYKSLAREHHPDKGGDPERFKEISYANEILGDPEKRSVYDKYGKEGLEGNRTMGPADLFSGLFGGGGARGCSKKQRSRTKDVVHVLPVTLEQLYAGHTKKMAVNRQVVDNKCDINTCAACDGRGVKVEVVQIGAMSQHMQSTCTACTGTGKLFKLKKKREVVEVLVQKGAADGHRVVFRGKADERPDADTGDVIFVLREQEHKEFRRKEADLYVERKISLVEALCGFELEVTHLDGRRLVVKSSPGEVVKPMMRGFDPLAEESGKMDWESLEDVDCPDIQTVARAETSDLDTLKKACETQLKRDGVEVAAFVVDSNEGRAYFKSGTREEILGAKQPRHGCTTYVVADPGAQSHFRVMKAVKGEGMPTFKNPFITGNLFLILSIEFPDSLSIDAQEAIRGLLPSPLNVPTLQPDSEDVEVHTLADIDPVQSYNSNRANMVPGGEAYDEDEERGAHGAGQQTQCAQM